MTQAGVVQCLVKCWLKEEGLRNQGLPCSSLSGETLLFVKCCFFNLCCTSGILFALSNNGPQRCERMCHLAQHKAVLQKRYYEVIGSLN